MDVPIDLNKVQLVIYYLNNVRMSDTRRERLHCLMVEGILKGSLDMEEFFAKTLPARSTGVEVFAWEVRAKLEGQGWIQAELLYERYAEWCRQQGVAVRSQGVFGRVLREIGVRKKSAKDANYYTFDSEEEGLHSA